MGVPGYFSWILKKYNKDALIKSKIECKIEHLFFDLNCAIHPAVKKNPNYTMEEMYKAVFDYIEDILDFVKPTKTIYIAIDGVAPRAKMEHQRMRRYKSVLYNKLANVEEKHDYNMISPGTVFMNTLNEKLEDYINIKNKTTNKDYILSGSNEPGEGEHKIFNYIRKNEEMKNIGIYGLDSDLLFLSLINYRTNMFIIREKQNLCPEMTDLSNYLYLDISLLREKLLDTLLSDNKKTIIDYCFFCFFLGNDFLPNLPSLKLKEGGVDILINIYLMIKQDLPNEYLINGVEINHFFFYKFINKLSIIEQETLDIINENRIMRINRFIKRMKYMPPEERKMEELKYVEWKTPDLIKFNQPNWKQRYYSYYNINPKKIKYVCGDYVKTMIWSLLYYMGLNNNWTWYYKYHIGPAISDFNNYSPLKKVEFKENNPVHPYLQLLYILPFESLNLLPDYIYNTLKEQDIYTHLYYPAEVKIDFMNKQYFFESILKLPEIDLKKMEYLFLNPQNSLGPPRA